MTLSEIGDQLKKEFAAVGIRFSQIVVTDPHGPTRYLYHVDVSGRPILFEAASCNHAIATLHQILDVAAMDTELPEKQEAPA